eukprot:Hpha_TRINITY_DN16209_c1_g4::TRINITY_DN16209_c1_g4_i1::g.13893::m.13893
MALRSGEGCDGTGGRHFALYQLQCVLKVGSAAHGADGAEGASPAHDSTSDSGHGASPRIPDTLGVASPSMSGGASPPIDKRLGADNGAAGVSGVFQAAKAGILSAAARARGWTTEEFGGSGVSATIETVRVARCEGYSVLAALCLGGAVVLRFSGNAAKLLGVKGDRYPAAPVVHTVTHFAAGSRTGTPVAASFSPDGCMLLVATLEGGIWLIPSARLLFPTSVREDGRSPLAACDATPPISAFLFPVDSHAPLSAVPTVAEGEEAALLVTLKRHRAPLGRPQGAQLRDVAWWRNHQGRDSAVAVADGGEVFIVCACSRQVLRTVHLPNSRPREVWVVAARGMVWALVTSHVSATDHAHCIVLERERGGLDTSRWEEAPEGKRKVQPVPHLPSAQTSGIFDPVQGVPQRGSRTTLNLDRSYRRSFQPEPLSPSQAVSRQRSHSQTGAAPEEPRRRRRSFSISRLGRSRALPKCIFEPQTCPRFAITGARVSVSEYAAGRSGVTMFAPGLRQVSIWDPDLFNQRDPLFSYGLNGEVTHCQLTSAFCITAVKPRSGEAVRKQQLQIFSRFAAASRGSRRSAGILQTLLLPLDKVAGMLPGTTDKNGMETVYVWTKTAVYELVPNPRVCPTDLFLSTLLEGPEGRPSSEVVGMAEALGSALNLDVVGLYQKAALQCADSDPHRSFHLAQRTGDPVFALDLCLRLKLPLDTQIQGVRQEAKKLAGRGGFAESAALALITAELLERTRAALGADTPRPAPGPPEPSMEQSADDPSADRLGTSMGRAAARMHLSVPAAGGDPTFGSQLRSSDPGRGGRLRPGPGQISPGGGLRFEKGAAEKHPRGGQRSPHASARATHASADQRSNVPAGHSVHVPSRSYDHRGSLGRPSEVGDCSSVGSTLNGVLLANALA